VGGGRGTVEGLVMTPQFWRGRRVLLTGHTGFKGSWLTLWLHQLGARVTGLSLAPDAESLFRAAGVQRLLDHRLGDIRDGDVVRRLFDEVKPEVVLHLAAQSLVRASYRDPLGTFATNVQGTAQVLNAAASCDSVSAVVVVTSDKCYLNREQHEGYRETDPMGGDDPYSASKGCAELVTHAWRTSFFGGAKVASARAGNVLGGGDWAEDRLVPDLMRAFRAGEVGKIRNPASVRPWQHVLEPLSGYLMLAERLSGDRACAEGWNFGPDQKSVVAVAAVADKVAALWGQGARWSHTIETSPLKESVLLQLDSAKAQTRLDWHPALSLDRALEATVAWYEQHAARADMAKVSLDQIDAYQRQAIERHPA
jgi:CDP-glucose 4,6-dehydratase